MAQVPMSVDELKHMAAAIRCDIIEMICTARPVIREVRFPQRTL